MESKSQQAKLQQYLTLFQNRDESFLQKILQYYDKLIVNNPIVIQFLTKFISKDQINQAHTQFKASISKAYMSGQGTLTYTLKQQGNTNQQVLPHFINWGGNLNYPVQPVLYPQNSQQIQNYIIDLKNKGKGSVRASGFRHSWSQIFPNPDQHLISILSEKFVTSNSPGVILQVAKILCSHQGSEEGGFYYIGEHPDSDLTNPNTKLIKIGAGVTNQQVRRWSNENKFAYPFNVIMVQITVVGIVATCSHGAGITNPTMSDMVYEIQFINCQGRIQVINKKNNPQLMKSAASAIGLLGIVISVTLQMQSLKHVTILPRILPLQQAIPKKGGNESHIQEFEKVCRMDYCEWFYFTHSDKGPVAYINSWNKGAPFTETQPIPEYPTLGLKLLQIVGTIGFNYLQMKFRPLFYALFSKFVFLGIPQENTQYEASSVDAIHFQRGVQNLKCRDFQVQINIPFSKLKNDYIFDVVREAFWIGMDIVEKNKSVVDIALELRIFGGSKCTLAPQEGYDATCSIQILRTICQNQFEQNRWGSVIKQIFDSWKKITYVDDDGVVRPVTIRPHWGKEWTKYEFIWEHLQADQAFQKNVTKFKEQYNLIAQLGDWNPQDGKRMFSTNTFNKLIFHE